MKLLDTDHARSFGTQQCVVIGRCVEWSGSGVCGVCSVVSAAGTLALNMVYLPSCHMRRHPAQEGDAKLAGPQVHLFLYPNTYRHARLAGAAMRGRSDLSGSALVDLSGVCGACSFVSAAGTSGSGDSAHSSGLMHAKLSQLLHLSSLSSSVRRATPLTLPLSFEHT